MHHSNYSFSMPKSYHSIELPKTFPEDIECIIKGKSPDFGSLFISNVEAASNPATLKKLKIAAVLSCAKGYELKHPRSVVPHYKYIPTLDQDECDISIHFDEAVDFIREALKQTNVLAHCIAGVSRSVSMVLAYFIREHNMHYDEAYRLVKSKRKIIHPNDGFIRQLKKYSETLKTQQQQARRAGNSSPRINEERLAKEKNSDNYRTMADFKSIELSPNKELTPQKSAQGELYGRYASTQMKNSAPLQNSESLKREDVFQSLPYIPDPDEPAKQQTLTPKTKNEAATQDNLQLQRTSTNYFTPNKGLVNQKPYENIRKYEDYSKSVKLQRPTTSPIQAKAPVSPLQTRPEPSPGQADPEFYNNRGDFFASKNTELNEKIELIRKKYAAEREKLFNKYQSPDRQRPEKFNEDKPDPFKTNERRRVSLGEFKTDRPPIKPYDFTEEKKLAPADVKRENGYSNNKAGYQTYGQAYAKKYGNMSIGSPKLNEEDAYYSKPDALRGNIHQANQRNQRDYDRLGGLLNQFNYPSYSPYYSKYSSSAYKRYY